MIHPTSTMSHGEMTFGAIGWAALDEDDLAISIYGVPKPSDNSRFWVFGDFFHKRPGW
jgi:hypothetical protein